MRRPTLGRLTPDLPGDSLDGGPLPSRLPAAVVGVIGMIAVIGVGAASGVPAVERHLQRDIQINVLADVPSVRAVVDGRTVSLSGLVNSADDRRQLGDRVTARWGVTSVRLDAVKVRPRAVQAKGVKAASSN